MIDELLKQAEEFKKELKKEGEEKTGQCYLNYLKGIQDHHIKTKMVLRKTIKNLDDKDDKIKLAYLINDIDDKIEKIEKRWNSYHHNQDKTKLRIDL